MVQYTFEKTPGAYDGGALCAAVLFASEHKCTKWLDRLLQNRSQSENTSDVEGTAVGLAAWCAEMKVLKTLWSKFGTPLAALYPAGIDGHLSYVSDSVKTALSEWRTGNRKLPFWHDNNSHVTEPLSFILQSSSWTSKLRELGYRPEDHLIDLSVDLNSEDVLQIQLSSRGQEQDHSLFSAVHDRDLVRVKAFLDTGKDVNWSLYMHIFCGRSLLQQAVENGDLDMIDLLLKAGAEVNAPAASDCGATALQLAAIMGRVGIAKMLIEKGADVNAPRAERGGRTALEGAAEHGRIDMIQLLLSERADTGGRGRLQYMLAIKFAEEQAHWVAANMLREYRDWTADDDELWSVLNGHPKD
ncbi:ankyrin repeat-containing domain protein [Colletotrichum godetiae]|uniref:Ankyrin repeat-containing domain protein n=1 Tax=Colletotrichum godetiae TaxID=1209918 RepID=A0AAJ0ADV2_9PEZI|nr:ankyrin repeat-containing domain protein [Colletotrichum godetiae]KAK1672064.1 ankyrin repeat-containing domain protein [Colletotrichum godetiae]